ncbi:interleukin-4 [Grus japonensis]|uniref:Interleukin-4 n=1 Tax=Grus japonensis TaxID=30415 RepID=A0ABC9XFL0_GRUJA
MSIPVPVPVLLTLLVLSACQGHMAALLQTSNFLKESIRLLSVLLETEVSCDKMNVTNIFADNKHDNDMEILCKATTVTWEGGICHSYLKGISVNLLQLIRRKSTVHKSRVKFTLSLGHWSGALVARDEKMEP